jgi:thymidylate synthase
MRILGVITGEYGERHMGNVREHAPDDWTVEIWRAPSRFPIVIDYPEDYVPDTLPAADLILSFPEVSGVAELIPDVAKLTGAKSVVAAVDNEAWLPRGLARQLRGWLERMDVFCVTPKPLCSLTETHFGIKRGVWEEYDDPFISEFARHFGRPQVRITVDPETREISAAEVERDAVCGNTRFVAERLVGLSADDAAEQAGLLHHHHPCLASMGKDVDFGDTLMHVSGNVLKDNVAEQVKPFRRITYIAPGRHSE